MKTRIRYSTFVLLLLLPMLALSNNDTELKGKHKKEKVIKKSFNVNANATLEVDNSYGNLDIITWQENRIEIEVTITTNSSNEEKAQQKLDEITVDFDASSNHVSARTVFNKNRSNSWWKWNNSNNVNMKVNYVIKMPITNHVDLSNDYGSINLDKLEGSAKISCDYGKITTKELLSDDNIIDFDYTSNCYFEYIKSGKINADYSGFTVGKTKSLHIDADYSKSKIEIAEDVTYDCDYGGITIEKVNNVSGDGDYLTTRIGDVYKNVTIEADYGSIEIGNMTAHAGSVTINSDYVGIKIGHNSNYSFNFDINLEYASLRDHEGFEFNKKRVESGDKYYSGYYGTEDSGNLIKINSDYGSISFKKTN